MSLRLEMLQVARLAPKLLAESAELVRQFLLEQQNEDGGFKDRVGKSDLYYTVFGVDSLLALQVVPRWEALRSYLQSFDNGERLDFVHLCCLARGWATVIGQGSRESRSTATPGSDPTGGSASHPAGIRASHPAGIREALECRLASFRARDGGYNPMPDADFGTAYGAFLALGAYQDLGAQLPDPFHLVQSLKFLETPDGAWTNERSVKSEIRNPKSETVIPHSAFGIPHSAMGSTNATAAAVAVLRNLGMPMNSAVGDWLLARAHPQGGFRATPTAPIPDLLSTATALHALAGMQISFEHVREACLDFIDSLWTNAGSFHGHWHEEALDCEYTFYGLLALGHLGL